MNKEKRIKGLLDACMTAVEKWDDLSPDEQNHATNMILEAAKLSNERNSEICEESMQFRDEVEEKLNEFEAALIFYEAFLTYKGLVDEFKDFAEEFFKENHPHLTLVQ